jgi:hypothetical protein
MQQKKKNYWELRIEMNAEIKEMRGTKSIIYFKNCVKDFRDFGT